jgi:hypothetical protein
MKLGGHILGWKNKWDATNPGLLLLSGEIRNAPLNRLCRKIIGVYIRYDMPTSRKPQILTFLRMRIL